MTSMPARHHAIRIRGARQNNLKNLDLDLPTGELIVVTGCVGIRQELAGIRHAIRRGAAPLRRTFSPYARQFWIGWTARQSIGSTACLPPSRSIRPTRCAPRDSTVGTMTELNDHLKLLFARAAVLHCRGCGKPVRRDSPQQVVDELQRRCSELGDPRLTITFPIIVPANFTPEEDPDPPGGAGYTRVHAQQATASGQRSMSFRTG